MNLKEQITEIVASTLSENDIHPRVKEIFTAFKEAGYFKPMQNYRAILVEQTPNIIAGKFVAHHEEIEVTVLAVAGNYAMVRRKGAMPFICKVKDLRKKSND